MSDKPKLVPSLPVKAKGRKPVELPLNLGIHSAVLDEAQRWLLINALKTAADYYRAEAEHVRREVFRSRTAEQFDYQAKAVDAMAEYLEAATQIEVRSNA